MIKLLVLLFSVNAVAEYELELKVSELDHKLGERYDFPTKLYQLGASYSDYFKYSVMTGQTEQAKNKSYGKRKTAIIRNFWVMSISKDFAISNALSIVAGVNYTEYKETVGSLTGPDTGIGYSYGLQYRAANSYSFKLAQTQYYRKTNKDLGVENTKGLGVSISYRL